MGRFKTRRNKSKRSKKRNNANVKKQQKVGLSSFSSAEVVDIVLNDEHPDFNLEKKILVGSIKARRLKEEFGVEEDTLNYYAPYFGTGMWVIPLKGEIVQLVSALGRGAQRDNKSEEMYYLPPINIWQDPNHNQLPASSYQYAKKDGTAEAEICNPSGQYSSNPGTENRPDPEPPVPLGFIFEEKDVQRLFPYEGDIILEGRGGHSIRMGSTVKKAEYKNWWSSTGENGDPITIISDDHSRTEGGDYKIEDVNGDGGIVILACTQKIPINIISKDGDNLRWDSYDHTPTAKKQDASELNYKEVVKEKEKKGEPESATPVDDKDQVSEQEEKQEVKDLPCDQCPDGTTPEKDKNGDCDYDSCPEENDPVEIVDIIFGDAVAHGLSGRPGTGTVTDHPDGPFGTSKYLASPGTVERFIRTYPTDQIKDKTVVVSSGLIAHTVDFDPGVVHMVENRSGQTNKVISYDVFSTSARPGIYYMDKHTNDYVAKNILGAKEGGSSVGYYTFHDKNKSRDSVASLWKAAPGTDQPNSKRCYELIGSTSQLNISQTVEQMYVAFADDVVAIKKQLQYLTDLNCSVKLCGVGDGRGTKNGLNFNDLLQDIADGYDNTTFIGGYDRDRGKATDFYPADADAYKRLVNAGTPAPRPNPTPPPDPVANITSYKGFNIEEKDYTRDNIRSNIYAEPATYYFRVTEEASFKLTVPPGYDASTDCIQEALGEREHYFNDAGSGGLGSSFLQGSDVTPQSQNPKMSGTNKNYIELIKRKIDLLEEDHFDTFCF